MKVYAIASPHPVKLEELELYTSKFKAEKDMVKMQEEYRKEIEEKNKDLREQKSVLFYGYNDNAFHVVEIEVDEYPAIEELRTWLNTLTNPENLPGIEAAFKRAEKYGLEYEIMLSAFNRQDEPDFEIVEQLHEACYRWDV